MAARLATYLVVAIVAGTLIAGLIVGAQRADDSGPVDLIIHNAKVYAADDLGTIADAVAIRGNKILRVGGEREIMRYRRPQTTVIDAKGAAVLPGFDDAHVSLIAGGLARDGVQLFGATTLEEIQAAGHDLGGGAARCGVDHRIRLDLRRLRRPAAARASSMPPPATGRRSSCRPDGQALWLNTKALAAAQNHQAHARIRSTASSSATAAASRPDC